MRSKVVGGGGQKIPLFENTSCLPTGPQTFPAAYRDLPPLTTQRGNCASPFLGKMRPESRFPSPLPQRRGRAGCAGRGRCAGAQVRWTAPERGSRAPRPWQHRRYRRGTSPPPPPPGRQPASPHPVTPSPPALLSDGRCRGCFGGLPRAG